jgi:hypothetical protein
MVMGLALLGAVLGPLASLGLGQMIEGPLREGSVWRGMGNARQDEPPGYAWDALEAPSLSARAVSLTSAAIREAARRCVVEVAGPEYESSEIRVSLSAAGDLERIHVALCPKGERSVGAAAVAHGIAWSLGVPRERVVVE